MSDGVTNIGNTSVRILVPSRRKDGGVVHPEVRREWSSRAAAQLEMKPFGGSTPDEVIGSYVHDGGRVTREEITIRTSVCPRETLADEAARIRVLGFAKEMCAALGQDSIFVGWGDTAYVVSATFDPANVPVVPFSSLSPEAQLKHLTMGWGGIDGPAKVLQVLSLDTWTLPSDADLAAAPPDQRLVLRGVAGADATPRRAWSWVGTLDELGKERKAWAGAGIPAEGDLVFLQGEGTLLFVLLTAKGYAGPRDLRLSHGQLNPVTRHLLLRILRREWEALARDLQQRPLDDDFFPKLQKLRAKVEADILAKGWTGEAIPSSRKRKPSATEEQARKRAAFRLSVLIVGRMMFLRFLIEKGALPGGLDRLLTSFPTLHQRYYKLLIQPLWFDLLNTPESKRSAKLKASDLAEVPYLNGGLFQPRPGERELHLSHELFDPEVPGSFLDLFRTFQFSLNEHAGTDDAVKVDPSLFGRALETFNSHEDRKSEGVHYTPKPIAWALALEAILERVAYLSKVPRERLEGLLEGRRSLTEGEAEQVRGILRSLRILDPAVGSGVLLWASLEVLLALDSACDGIEAGSDGYQRGSRNWGKHGRHFVCNCLYGVDLSEEAVELTRLRLWLAVALAEGKNHALPDLDLNVCRGDSLLPPPVLELPEVPKAKGRKGKKRNGQLHLELEAKDRIHNQLARLTRSYMDAGASDPAKQRRFRDEVLEARQQLSPRGDAGLQGDGPLAWRTFFPHVFADPKKSGFDVVIANPPYIRIQGLKKTEAGKIYLLEWSTLASGNPDLSYAFVELALRDLAAPEGGQVAFIQPNFRQHDAAAAVRDLLLGRSEKVPARLRLWVDFDDAQVFPTATNYVALLFAERTPAAAPQAEFTYTTPSRGSWSDAVDLGWLRPKGGTHQHPAEGDWLTVPWDLRTRVIAAAQGANRKLGDVAEIQVGVQTSADKVFLFEDEPEGDGPVVEVWSRELDRKVQVERAILRPCLKGSAGDGYQILFPYDEAGKLLSAAALRRSFPKAWAYLEANRETLAGREKGKFKDETWYRFGRSQGTLAASQAKVLVPSLLRKPEAVVDREGRLVFTASGKGGGGAWALVPKPGSGVGLDELAAQVTSGEAWDHVLAYGSPQQGGWKGVDAAVLEEVPV